MHGVWSGVLQPRNKQIEGVSGASIVTPPHLLARPVRQNSSPPNNPNHTRGPILEGSHTSLPVDAHKQPPTEGSTHPPGALEERPSRPGRERNVYFFDQETTENPQKGTTHELRSPG
jgi:hypothetical protein